jgi:flagellar biosynthesis/type III secretory pathway M-ring protein FliF/YscJ
MITQTLETMAPTRKTNKFQNTITLGQLIGVGFSIIGSIVVFVIMVNVRLSNLENNQSALKEQYNDFGAKMDKFIDKQTEKFDKFTNDLNDIKVLLHDKVDKK